MPPLNFWPSLPSVVRDPSGNTISDAPERAIRCIRLKIAGAGFVAVRPARGRRARRCQPMNGTHPSAAFAMIRSCRGSAVKRIGMS